MPCSDLYYMFQPEDGGRWTRNPHKRSNTGGAPMPVPCGTCDFCKARIVQEWKTRMKLHSRYYPDHPWMICCTYADEHLPDDYSVSRRQGQLWIKRLRKKYDAPYKAHAEALNESRRALRQVEFADNLSFFLVGEYGEDEEYTRRPHYHTIVWGLPISEDELTPWKPSRAGFPQWISEDLTKVWGYGHVTMSKADDAAMSYCAGYLHKRICGLRRGSTDAKAKFAFKHKWQREHYTREHPVTGEICVVRPEFTQMSRRPAIGLRWAQEFRDHDLQHDNMHFDGKAWPMPSFFKRKLRDWMATDADREEHKDTAREKGVEYTAKHAKDLTPARLAARAEHKRLVTKSLARGGGNGP